MRRNARMRVIREGNDTRNQDIEAEIPTSKEPEERKASVILLAVAGRTVYVVTS